MKHDPLPIKENIPNQWVKQPILYKKLGMAQAKKLSKELANFAKDNDLSVQIAGKQYMQVEGWQFIGTQMGLTDVVQSCDPVSTDDPKEVKYKAEVIVINQNGTIISRGFAFASNKENKKRSFEEYAVASMAQTRAIGKAYRNFLAWIVKMAGYEPTPYEEVDKEKMETDLSKAKQNLVKTFTDYGITESSEMIRVIEVAIGKTIIETTDEVYKVKGYLDELQKDENETN